MSCIVNAQIDLAQRIRDLGGLGRGVPGDGVITTDDPDGVGVRTGDWGHPHVPHDWGEGEGDDERKERAYGGEEEEKHHDGRDEERGGEEGNR